MSPLASGYVKEGRRIGSFSPKVILLWHNILFRQKTFFAQIFCYVNQVQVMTCQSDSFFHQITKPQKNYIYVYSGQKAGIEKGGATPTSISIFDSYYMKTLWFKIVMISSLASKWQVLKVGMPIFQPLYEVKLKASKFKVLAFWSQWRYHD